MNSFNALGLSVRHQALGMLSTNCYVVTCAETGDTLVIDSVAQIDAISAMVDAHTGSQVVGLWQTHAHIDHVAALCDTKERYSAPILLHKEDMPLYQAAPLQGQMFGVPCAPLPPPDRFVEEGDTLTLGKTECKVLLTPGHTPGSICFYFEEQKLLFSGDVLFAGSIGRTDLPGGHSPTMMQSLQRMLATIPDDVTILSGHGPITTMGRERQSNPFLRQLQ